MRVGALTYCFLLCPLPEALGPASRLRRRYADAPAGALLTGRGTAAGLRAFRKEPYFTILNALSLRRPLFSNGFSASPGDGGGESRRGMKIRRAARPVGVRVLPPAPFAHHHTVRPIVLVATICSLTVNSSREQKSTSHVQRRSADGALEGIL